VKPIRTLVLLIEECKGFNVCMSHIVGLELANVVDVGTGGPGSLDTPKQFLSDKLLSFHTAFLASDRILQQTSSGVLSSRP
jgi:hypothetical protein